jgi:tetratricopeptide (TPR) repeat protein
MEHKNKKFSMKKTIFISLLLAPLFIISQNLKKEKVKTSFLSYPKVDVKNMDPSTLQVDFCTGNIAYLGKSTKKTTTACKPKGGSLKDTKALEVFYYHFNTLIPASYLKISNSKGEIQLIERINKGDKSFEDFGKKKCYWVESVLKSAYDKNKASFEAKNNKEFVKLKIKKSEEYLASALFFSYVPHTVEVLYPKDKNQNYTDLEKAATIAAEGYEGLKDNADDKEAQSKLRQAISIWEKALTESTPDTKNSRINKKVTLAISENTGRAYMYLMEFDKAKEIVKKALNLEKNFSNNATQRRESLLSYIKENKKGYDLNKETPVNLNVTKIMIKQHPASEIASFTEDYKKFGNAAMAEEIAESKEEYDKAVESGEINPYQKFVMETSFGKQLTLPDLTAKMMKEPAGEKLSELPEDVTKLTDLSILILRGNNLKALPGSIGNLTNLKKLVLTNNQLTTLPDEIGNLKELKNLNLKGNNISAKEISKIKSLLPNCKIKL